MFNFNFLKKEIPKKEIPKDNDLGGGGVSETKELSPQEKKQKALDKYAHYLNKEHFKIESLSKSKIEPTLQELNDIAGVEYFKIVEFHPPRNISLHYKIVVVESAFQSIQN